MIRLVSWSDVEGKPKLNVSRSVARNPIFAPGMISGTSSLHISQYAKNALDNIVSLSGRGVKDMQPVVSMKPVGEVNTRFHIRFDGSQSTPTSKSEPKKYSSKEAQMPAPTFRRENVSDESHKVPAQASEGSAAPTRSRSSAIRGRFQFVSKFHHVYQRNNKRGGQKNLRCFPGCVNNVHRLTGFCGQPAQVRLSMELNDLHLAPREGTMPQDPWILIAAFEQKRDTPSVDIGAAIPYDDALRYMKSKEFPLRPWYRGTCVKVQASRERAGKPAEGIYKWCIKANYEINRRRKAWHYGWTSNKHRTDRMHVLRAYMFEKVDGDLLVCRFSCSSSPFNLICRRRAGSLKPESGNVPSKYKGKESSGDTSSGFVLDRIRNKKRTSSAGANVAAKRRRKKNDGEDVFTAACDIWAEAALSLQMTDKDK